MYQLRPYQSGLISQIIKSMKAGHHRIVVQSPPRTGKTVIMAEIARRTTNKNNRVMFIIHRKEVLEQAIATFKEQDVDPNLATMGMVQTLTRKVNKLPKPRLILVDEAHHALAKSYQRILKQFPKAYVLLFTATPIRTGRQQLDLVADDIIIGQSIKELTKKGFLASFKYYSVPDDDIDPKKLKRSSTGDYTKKSMDEAINNKIYGHVVKNYLKLAKGKQAVVYTYSVESAKKIAKEFNTSGIKASEVDGKTAAKDRDNIVQDFRDKKITILVNVNLFTEGVDLPNVDCVIMARPTKSLALYMQFSMRCLNPRPGKIAIIIDHVKNYKKFGLPNFDRDWNKAIKTSAKRLNNGTKSNISIITCPSCFGVLDRNYIKKNTCYLCGYEPVMQKPDKVVVESKLKEINQKAEERKRKTQKRKRLIEKIVHENIYRNTIGKKIGQLRSYKEFEAYAEIHGYSYKWAYITFNRLIKKRRVK